MHALRPAGLTLVLATMFRLPAVAGEPVEAPRPARRPELRLDSPQEGNTYIDGSSIAVMGRLSPPIEADVEVLIYAVTDDGGLIRQSGAALPLMGGQFRLTIDAPAGGWRAGRMAVVARLGDMTQVSARRELGVAKRADKGVDRDRPVYEPRSSGLVADLDEGFVEFPVVIGQKFLVQGTFVVAAPLDKGPQGPPCLGIIQRLLPDGRPIIMDTAPTIPLRHLGGRWWYEIELTAPERPGDYTLSVESPPGASIVRPITLMVVDPLAARDEVQDDG